MEQKIRQMVSKELEHLYCSMLLDDVRGKVRKLKMQSSISTSLVMGKGLVANGVNHNFATNQLLCQN